MGSEMCIRDRFDKDVSLAPSLVAVQTLLSMITMPLVLGLAKFLV